MDYTPLQEENLSQQLAEIPKYKWQEFFRIADNLKNSQNFGEIDGGQIDEEGYSTLPFYKPSIEVRQFIKKCYEIPIIVNFDWMGWHQGPELLNDLNTDYSSLPFETLVKLLTAIIRADRFNEGYLLSKLEDGSLLKIFDGIKDKLDL